MSIDVLYIATSIGTVPFIFIRFDFFMIHAAYTAGLPNCEIT